MSDRKFREYFTGVHRAGVGFEIVIVVSVLLANYALGCFATGYYFVRLTTDKDIRELGSGSIGARNVGRHAGALGFSVTMLGDLAKGALAVWATQHFTGNDWLGVVSLLAVLSGHIWPIQLGFRGGKGMATSLGALLIFDPFAVLLMAVLCLAVLALFRRTTLAALAAYAFAPFVSVILFQPLFKIAGLSLVAALVLLAHRKNLLEEFAAMDSNRKLSANSRKLPK
jgi:glycerol-3-phosphate acyltransferase PlsY